MSDGSMETFSWPQLLHSFLVGATCPEKPAFFFLLRKWLYADTCLCTLFNLMTLGNSPYSKQNKSNITEKQTMKPELGQKRKRKEKRKKSKMVNEANLSMSHQWLTSSIEDTNHTSRRPGKIVRSLWPSGEPSVWELSRSQGESHSRKLMLQRRRHAS